MWITINTTTILSSYINNIIDSMPSVLVGIDPQGQVTQWNSEAQRAMDIPASEAIGQPFEKVFPIPLSSF